MLCIVGSLGIHAQKDVTSQYITNAKLSEGTSGWTVLNFNNPVSGNGEQNVVGDNAKEKSYNTIGYASEAYAGWDNLSVNSFHLTQKITLPIGHYTLVSYSFFRQGQGYNTNSTKSLAFLKAGSDQVAIKTLGSIVTGGYANSQIEGAVAFDSKMYRNTLNFNISADNTEIEIGLVGTFDEMRSWCIAGMFELINNDIPATMDAPFDVTGYLTNPGFEYRNMNGWTLSPDDAIGTQVNDQSFKTGFYYAEKWQPSANGALSARSMSQTLTSLPAGLYRLTANLGGNGTYIDLNGKTVNCTDDGNYTASYVLPENNALVITAGKTAEGSATWIHFDNFKLLYCGDVQAALTTSLNKKTSYNGLIPTAAYEQLQTDVAPYAQQYTDVDELLAAIDAVEALYTEADKLKVPYTDWKALKAKADVLVNVSNDNETANGTFATAISAQNTAAEAATTVAGLTAATTTLKDAMVTYVGAANPEGNGAQFDCTFMLTNPDLTNFAGWTKNVAGWYTDQTVDGQNSQTMHNGNVAGPHGDAFYEYWSPDAVGNGKFTLYQMVELPVGTYTINCDAFASADNVQNATTSKVYFYANETQGSLVSNGVLTPSEISFVNAPELPATTQEVKIGLKVLEGNQFRWMGIGYVKLYKVPAQTYTIDENATTAYDYTQSGAGAVTLKRTIKVGLNSLVLPFSMTQAEVENYFGEGSKVYVVGSYDASKSLVNFTTQQGIQANTPCILEATEANSEYTIADRTIVAANSDAPTVTTSGLSFIGSYAVNKAITKDAGNYILYKSSTDEKDKLYFVDVDDVSMDATRAYFNVASETPAAGSRVLSVEFEGGEATGIAEIEDVEIADGLIYNLAGQVVGPDYKGIAIINGKKVLMK